ncbi:MAG: hypothetical protein DCC75_13045, partial [Proteobacteria bacterium]
MSSGGQAARQASEDPKVLPPIEMPLDSVNSLAVLWQEMVTEQDEIHIYGDYLAAQLAGGKVTNDRAHALYSRQFNSLRNQAEQLAAAQDLEALDGDKVLMAADIMLMRWKNHTEVQELLAEFKDAPEQWKSRRAFWWTVYRYCGADQPEQLENVWWDSQILHPHLINQRVRYASPLSLALRDFGRIDAAQTMLEGALALALSSRASIVEHDDGDPWEYRRVSQATLARTVCLLASLKDDDARPVCLAEWRMKLSKFPKALELIEALWPAYEMYNRPFPRIRQTSIEGQVV